MATTGVPSLAEVQEEHIERAVPRAETVDVTEKPQAFADTERARELLHLRAELSVSGQHYGIGESAGAATRSPGRLMSVIRA